MFVGFFMKKTNIYSVYTHVVKAQVGVLKKKYPGEEPLLNMSPLSM